MKTEEVLKAADLIEKHKNLSNAIKMLYDDDGKNEVQVIIAPVMKGMSLESVRMLQDLDDLRIVNALRSMLMEDVEDLDKQLKNMGVE